ncbi:MAG: tetratricopeptide repeat protein [Cyanobacteriota bacterium]|nr:tetratricopeptide repeat protein [Cyanobacteriota bacterium]
MSNLVTLKLDGYLEGGFRVAMSVGSDGERPRTEVRGNLPASEELVTDLKQHWETNYRTVGAPARIKPKRIHYNNRRRSLTSIDECRRSADKLSDRLNTWLRSEQFRDIDTRLREQLNPEEPIRLLISTQDNSLQKLPWHLWDFVRRYPRSEVAFSPLNYHQPSFSFRSHTSNKVRILAILGHAEDIDIEKDRELLESLPNAEIVFLVEPKRSDISDRLWNQPWDIIFFAGHSETEGEVGKIYLNDTDSLTVNELWYALRKAVDNGLQLGIFNSCDGLGLAQQLDDLQIPQTIVMRELVPDLVAQEFLKHFLTSFSSGQSFYLAAREAREKLQDLENKYPCATWLPVICQNPAVLPPSWQDLLNKDELNSTLNYPPARTAVKQSNGLRYTNKKSRFAVLLFFGLGFVLTSQLTLPKLAIYANNYGFKSYQKGDFARAKSFLNVATFIDPSNQAAPYTLGIICEQFKESECAKKQYLRSAKLGLNAAYAQLGRFYLKLKSYSHAVDLLLEGLERSTDDRITYSLQKNLGWARLKQGRYLEALEHLQEAIELDSDRAPARCLLAQVYEGIGDNKAAIEEWQTCLKNAKPENPDEDIWIGMARERLQLSLSENPEVPSKHLNALK